ncbi:MULTISPECIES: glycoside hydrolase family 75 protein [unclassified Streptomyces]|uniref:glycoside hydrolase family 75 protein n=2 Tax=unclassified Streptomyces TaxID=2593676 RepID=UPI001F0CBF06|nr:MULTISPECIES: glycoside hydrolase family 75 protein [unclassified Streptomyces]
MSRVQSITLAMAGVALLAPPAPPAAPQPRTEPVARRAEPVSVRRPAPALVRRPDPAPTRQADRGTPRHAEPVTAAELLAEVSACTPVSRGRYRKDQGSRATVRVCGTSDAVFWKADMDIDCDGRPGRRCNASTDPYFSASTAFAQSDGRPLSSERLPYVVVPAPSTVWNHRAHGVRGGSVAAMVYRDRVRYAVVGDTGPAGIIGEASYAAAESLGIDPDPRSGGTPSGVTYIVFKNSRATPIEDPEAAVAQGERLAREFVGGDG